MFKSVYGASVGALLLLVLSGYGIGAPATPPRPDPEAPARLEQVMSSEHGLARVAFRGDDAYLSLSDPASGNGGVLATRGAVAANSTWTPVVRDVCAAVCDKASTAMTTVQGNGLVYIGVEGGLLRSDDGGNSFKFVLRHAVDDSVSFPAITQLLSPAHDPDVIIAAGFDKVTGKAYLAWSPDRGQHWIELSSMLPGSERMNNTRSAEVTSLAEDANGRLLLTMNEEADSKGKLMQLTLGKTMNWLLL
jgi:hypothetical protein